MLKRLIRRHSAKEVDTATAAPTAASPIASTPQQPKLRVDLSKQKSTETKPVKKEEVVVVEHPRFVGSTPPHILAYEGRYEELKAAIEENPYVAYESYNYNGNIPLLTRQEEDDELFMPPPLIPKNVRAALAVGDVRRMTRDERWILAKGFGESSLLHYACAGNRFQIVKYLIEMVGVDRHMMNVNQKPAEYYSDSDVILEYIWSRDRLEQLSSSRNDANRAKTKSGRILKPRASEYLEKLRATLENVSFENHNSDDNNSQSSSGFVYKSKIPFQQSFSHATDTKRPFANFQEGEDSVADSRRSSLTDTQQSITNSRRLSKRRLSRVLSTRRMQENELNINQEYPENEKVTVISSVHKRAPPPPPRPDHLFSTSHQNNDDESLLDELETPSIISEKEQEDIISNMSRPPLVMRRLSTRSDNSDTHTTGHQKKDKHSERERKSIAASATRASIKRAPPPPPPTSTSQIASPPSPPLSTSASTQHVAPLPPPPLSTVPQHPGPPPPPTPAAPPSTLAAPKPPPLSTITEQKQSSNHPVMPSITISNTFTERRSTYRSNKDLIDDEFEMALQLAYEDAKARNDRILSEAKKDTHQIHQLTRAADILKRFRPIEHLANTLLSENSEDQEHVYKRAQRNLRLLQQQQQASPAMRPAIPGVYISDKASEAGDSVVTATPSISSFLPAHDARWKNGVSMESVTFLEMIWRHAAKGMNRGVFDTPTNANSRQAREFHALRQDAYRSGVRMLKKEFKTYAQKEKWEGIELLRMKALTTMIELRRRLRAAQRAKQLCLSAAAAAAGNTGVLEDKPTSPDVSATTKSLRKTVSFAHPNKNNHNYNVNNGDKKKEDEQGRRKSVLDVLLAEGEKGNIRAQDSFHMSIGARGIMTVDELSANNYQTINDAEEESQWQAMEEEQLLRQAVRRLSIVDNDFDLEYELEQLQRRMELTELWQRK